MKDLIRMQNLAKRNTLDKEQIKQKSSLIQEKLEQLPEYQEAKAILFYFGVKNEVQTGKMIKSTLEKGKKVFLPKTNFEKRTISIVQINSLENLVETKQGLFEPEGKEETVETIDLIILPGVAFDLEGRRIGQGMGFYDSLLRKTKTNVPLVGLCFEENIEEEIPTESHDIEMNIIITDQKTTRCKK